MGTVYEAVDADSQQRVALKTFRRLSSDAVFRLKREFRNLAGVEHPNLVRLHELFVVGDEVFFSMELVDGCDILSYVGQERLRADEVGHTLPVGQRELACDEARLRRVLPQLAAAISALHSAGKLHRDIKPSNVLVTNEGVVKVLDFGLMIDIDDDGGDSTVGHAVGTPGYMSPEQAVGDPHLGPASDWYAFGTVLYQALTGGLPFSGAPLQVLLDKTQRVPAPPRQVVPDVPPDLDGLAERLLDPAPESRLRGQAVLEQLGVARAEIEELTGITQTSSELAPYHGRADELASLRQQFERVRDLRQPRLAVVVGDSGMGKSAFVAEFLARLRDDRRDLVALRGRCYESETVPHNALDPVVDQLSAHWRRIDDASAAYLLPSQPHLLPQLFPVLGRVPAVVRQPRHPLPDDPQQRRDAAYQALRETLARLANQSPLILVIDDMQWTDDDSLLLLSDLLHPTKGVPALIVLGTRPAGLEAGRRLASLVQNAGNRAEVLTLAPMADDECTLLARRHLDPMADAELVSAVVREARGNPFFVTELARYVASVGDAALEGGLPRIGDLIDNRVKALPADARRLLEVLAVSAEPLEREVASSASGLDGSGFAAAVRHLRGTSLARSGGRSTETLECYHDRIRRSVAGSLEAERVVEHHRALAGALRANPQASDERIASHYRGCGDAELAAEYFERAARRSLNELEFARASSQFALALELGDFARRKRFELLVSLGDTLGKAGRHADAAKRFEEALDGADHEHEAIDLRRRIAESWLACGALDEGIAAAEKAAAAAGMPYPGYLRTVFEVLWARVRYRWVTQPKRGVAGHLASGDVTARARAETCMSLSNGLAWLDVARSAAFGARLMGRARAVGDADLLVHARGWLAVGAAYLGERNAADRATAQLDTLDDDERGISPLAAMYRAYARSVVSYLDDFQPDKARDLIDEADRAKTEAGLGDAAGTEALLFWRMSLYWGEGRLRAFSDLVLTMLSTSMRNGNRFVEVAARAFGAIRHLVDDEPDRALEDFHAGLALWPPRERQYTSMHFFAENIFALIQRYLGRPDAAYEGWQRTFALTKRARLLLIPNIRYLCGLWQGSLTMDVGAGFGPAQRLSRSLRRGRKHPLMARFYSDVLKAFVAERKGRTEDAVRGYQAILARPTIGMWRGPLQMRLSQLIGGSEGQALHDHASLILRREGVRNPERWSAAFVGDPAWWRKDAG